MRKPPPYVPDDPSGSTTGDELFACFRCHARLEILLSLIPGPLPVRRIAELLLYDVSHVSFHLRRLRGAKLVAGDPSKRQKLYHLSPLVEASLSPEAVTLVLNADDGCAVTFRMAATSPLNRLLAPSLRTHLRQALTRGPGSAAGAGPARKGSAGTPSRPPTGP